MKQTEKREIIEVLPNEQGRIIITLYGQRYDIHDNMFDEDGIAILKQFGKIYEIHKPVAKKKRSRKKQEEPKEEPITIGDVLPQEKESVSV